MTEVAFLELVVALSLQACVVIGACGWLVRQSASAGVGHRLWVTCHVMILTQIAVALSLPHLRLVPHSVVSAHVPIPIVVKSEVWLGRLLVSIWGVGAILYAVALLLGTLSVRRLIANARPFVQTSDLGADNVIVLVSSQVLAPFCWQLQHPTIVLPEITGSFPEEELQAIIRHERAHLQSAHPVFLFLQRMVEMLLWFHPLVWWASRQAELHREFHCDREASRSGEETACYLRSLLRLSEMETEFARRLPAGLGFSGSQSTVKQRVERLLIQRRQRPLREARSAVRAGLIAVAAVIATSLWLPINMSASSRSVWSPWPSWSARALYEFGISARDYEIDGHRLKLHELEEDADKSEAAAH